MTTGSGKTSVYVCKLVDLPSYHKAASVSYFSAIQSYPADPEGAGSYPRTKGKEAGFFSPWSSHLRLIEMPQLCWFLAPTVALCVQQCEVIASDIPSVGIRQLIGSDNVDFWSEQRIWDKALKNIRVVVSTPAILADALSHGFINISRLSLIVFDEGGLDLLSFCCSAYQGLAVNSRSNMSCSPPLQGTPCCEQNHAGFLPSREAE